MSDTPTLSPKKAAHLMGVHEDTLKKWAQDGKIPSFRTAGGWWRFRRSDIDAYLDGGGTRDEAAS